MIARAPAQGDVRLVNIKGTNFTTQPCDGVHLGVVEIFNDGQWGRICAGTDARALSGRGDVALYNVDARVICRQLGFPFGSVIDLREASSAMLSGLRSIFYEDYEDYDAPGALVWATDVQCTGTEERLEDCFFPQAFGEIARGDRDPDAPPGVPNADCRRQNSDIVAVACRRFEIKGALFCSLYRC